MKIRENKRKKNKQKKQKKKKTKKKKKRWYVLIFFPETSLDISYQTICMKCQSLFSGEKMKKRKYFEMTSAEFY